MSTVYCVTPPPTPSTWGPTFTVSRVTPLLRSCTWSHISTVFSMIPSRPWTWGHVSMVSSVIPLHKHCIWAHTSTVSSVTPPPTLSHCDHTSTVQGNPISQAIYLESSSLHGDLLPGHAPGITCLQSQGDLTTECLHLESHVHNPQGLPLPNSVPGVTHPHSPR